MVKLKTNYLLTMTLLASLFVSCLSTTTEDELLNKCISSANHKNVPGVEGKAIQGDHCTPWQNRSCCTWNTTSDIDKDGTLSLHNIVLDQCPKLKNMSDKCKQHFKRDTCFYECSPNLGPWIVEDPKSKKTRKERMAGVPLCSSDCDRWYNDCKEEYTCNDNWSKNWNWTNKGTPQMCTKQCKRFKEYFKSAKEFCQDLFDGSFKYHDTDANCMNLTPVGDKNLNVARNKAKEMAAGSSATTNKYSFTIVSVVSISICMWLSMFNH